MYILYNRNSTSGECADNTNALGRDKAHTA
jgi:hypothetical protein